MTNTVNRYAVTHNDHIVRVGDEYYELGYLVTFTNGNMGIYGKALLTFIPNEIAYLSEMGDCYAES